VLAADDAAVLGEIQQCAGGWIRERVDVGLPARILVIEVVKQAAAPWRLNFRRR